MDIEKKVVWSEGLFLQPQHFQQQERYLESYIHTTRLQQRFAWGFTELTLDTAELEKGKLGLRSAAGVFPDGTPFQTRPENTPVAIELPENAGNYQVYLGIRRRKKNTLEFAVERVVEGAVEGAVAREISAAKRYLVRQEKVCDAVSDAGHEIELQTAQLKFVLFTDAPGDSETRLDYAVLGVAKVMDLEAGAQAVLDDNYIPPVLNCRASPVLYGYMKEIYALLMRRSETLIERQVGSAPTGDELIDYLSLMLINRVQPVLSHLLAVNPVHPEAFYSELICLAGELSVLHADERERSRDAPPYAHDDLINTFLPLMGSLRRLLRHFVSPRAERLALHFKDPAHVTDIQDATVYDGTFVLAVSASVPTEELKRLFLGLAKVASYETIVDLVERSLKALPLTHLITPPQEIPHYQNWLYFKIEKVPAYWPDPTVSPGFAIYVPDETRLVDFKMNLWVIRRPYV